MSPRRAFTLIELLIVISIIGLLMGMLVVAIPNVIYNAKALKTASRIDAVLQGLSRVGQQEGSASMIMQRNACLGGVYQFDTASGYMLPTPAQAPTPGVVTARPQPPENSFFTDADLKKPYIFGFPWGKNDLICPGQTSSSGAADPDSEQGKTTVSTDASKYYFVSKVTLDQLNVDQQFTDEAGQQRLSSIALLEMADILPPDDPTTPPDESQVAYLTDRSPERAWNDAWGNPLVVAWGIFQPGGAWPGKGKDATAYNDPAQNIAGARCAEAWRQYQYNRSVYIAIAACGPVPYDVSASAKLSTDRYNDATLGNWPAHLQQVWDEATTVCQGRTAVNVPNPGGDWDSSAFDRPPWQGVKNGKTKVNGTLLRCQLSQPHEFK